VDLRDLPVADLGDWDVAGLGADDAPGVVERRARLVAGGPIACFLGGDETVLAPLVSGLAGGRLEEVGVLTVGSHTAPGQGSRFADLVRSGVALVRVGIHALADLGPVPGDAVEVVTMDAIDEVGAAWVVTSSLNDLAERCTWVFVGIDVGVLDAAFAPGCRSARPGGMTPRQLAAACRSAGAHPAVRAADLVGVDPARDPSGITVLNAAGALLAFAAGVAMRKAMP
jgi:arginase family enzyme